MRIVNRLYILGRKEWLDTIYGFQFAPFFIASTILLSLGCWVSAKEYQQRLRQSQALEALNRDQLRHRTDWRQLGEQGIFISLPPPVQAIFAHASNDSDFAAPRLIRRLEMPVKVEAGISANPDGSTGLSPLSTVEIFLSLFAIFLGYSAISHEKESSTLRMLLSVPINRPTLLIGKIVGRLVPAIIALMTALLVAVCIMFTVIPSLAGQPAFWESLIIFILLSSLYLTFFFLVGLFTSCISSTSLTSLLIAVTIWASLVFAIPKAGMSIVSLLIPPPSYAELQGKKSALWEESKIRFARAIDEPARQWMSPPGKADQDEMFRRQEEYNKEVSRLRLKLEGEYFDQVTKLYEQYQAGERRAREATQWVRMASPACIFETSVKTFAGLTPNDADRFNEVVWGYQKRFREFTEEIAQKKGEITYIVQGNDDPYALSRPSVDNLPAFIPPRLSFKDCFAGSVLYVSALCIYILVAFLLTHILFLRYDAR